MPNVSKCVQDLHLLKNKCMPINFKKCRRNKIGQMVLKCLYLYLLRCYSCSYKHVLGIKKMERAIIMSYAVDGFIFVGTNFRGFNENDT